jgi:hypothetical protein
MNKLIERRTNRRTAKNDIVVLYHADCTDGFAAAWAAFKHFGTNAQYLGVDHEVPPPDGLQGKEIYMVDFTYPQEETARLMRDNVRVTAIDHHASVRETTLATHQPLYAVDHSGAALAWQYFHPDRPLPTLLKYVEDLDLHRFVLPDSRAVNDWIDLFDFDFAVWNKLASTLERTAGIRRAVREGTLIRTYREKLVQRMASKMAYPVMFEGYRTLALNTELFHADTCDALVRLLPPIGIVWRQKPHGVYVSLRSDGTVDVSKLAVKHGGGGHAASAAFRVASPADLPFTRSTSD